MIRTLQKIFRPQRIAVIGVSNDPNSVGGITLKNLVSGGFGGVVYPINPKHEAVLGIPCFKDVKSLRNFAPADAGELHDHRD